MQKPFGSGVTIKDIAAECGVGLTTVHRALNDLPGVSEKTRQRIKEVAKSLQYLPNTNASALRAHTTKTITVVLKGSINPFFLTVLDKLEQEILRRGFFMQLLRVETEGQALSEGQQTWRQNKPAGLIFLGGRFQHKLGELRRLPVPFVFCTVPEAAGLAPHKYSSVAVDDTVAIHELVNHLYGLGHRKIAFLGPSADDRSVGSLRYRVYRQALTELGIEPADELVVMSSGQSSSYSLSHGYKMAEELVSRQVEFTALMAVSDVLAIGAQKALQDRGIRVPEDVSVTGFDGIEMSNFVTPTLTTIVQPVEEISSQACEVLFAQISDQPPSCHVLIPPTLRIGGSTGRVRPCR